METKLTLKLDEGIIRSAKKYAEENNRSLSRLVEDYFRNLVSVSEPEPRYSPLVQELSGVVTEKDLEDSDYTEWLEKKYE